MHPLFILGFEPMFADEKACFRQLGARIAEFCKSASITQVQLAETLSVSQQTVASWEVGRRGVPVATLPGLAHALSVSIESLIGAKATPGKRGPAPVLRQKIEQLTRPPQQMLDGVLSQAGR